MKALLVYQGSMKALLEITGRVSARHMKTFENVFFLYIQATAQSDTRAYSAHLQNKNSNIENQGADKPSTEMVEYHDIPYSTGHCTGSGNQGTRVFHHRDYILGRRPCHTTLSEFEM